jgi:hypothetical protein
LSRISSGMTDDKLVHHLGAFFPNYMVMRDKQSPSLCFDTYNTAHAEFIVNTFNLLATKYELPAPLAFVGSPEHECNKAYSSGSAPENPDSWVFLNDSALLALGPDTCNHVLSEAQQICQNMQPRGRAETLKRARHIVSESRLWEDIMGGSDTDKSGGRKK